MRPSVFLCFCIVKTIWSLERTQKNWHLASPVGFREKHEEGTETVFARR